jgi:hypothetical protein
MIAHAYCWLKPRDHFRLQVIVGQWCLEGVTVVDKKVESLSAAIPVIRGLLSASSVLLPFIRPERNTRFSLLNGI